MASKARFFAHDQIASGRGMSGIHTTATIYGAVSHNALIGMARNRGPNGNVSAPV